MTNEELFTLLTCPTLTDGTKEEVIRYIHHHRDQAITVMMMFVERKPSQ